MPFSATSLPVPWVTSLWCGFKSIVRSGTRLATSVYQAKPGGSGSHQTGTAHSRMRILTPHRGVWITWDPTRIHGIRREVVEGRGAREVAGECRVMGVQVGIG